jgi:hypothetical protein
VLELIKQHELQAIQEATFGEILLTVPVGGDPPTADTARGDSPDEEGEPDGD